MSFEQNGKKYCDPLAFQDDDDERPECEYGVDCYRKNPQHRKDFKHTRRPQPQRRAKRAAAVKKNRRRRGDDDEEEEEDTYEDSFIDDDSLEVEDISGDEESEAEWTPDEEDD